MRNHFFFQFPHAAHCKADSSRSDHHHIKINSELHTPKRTSPVTVSPVFMSTVLRVLANTTATVKATTYSKSRPLTRTTLSNELPTLGSFALTNATDRRAKPNEPVPNIDVCRGLPAYYATGCRELQSIETQFVHRFRQSAAEDSQSRRPRFVHVWVAVQKSSRHNREITRKDADSSWQ